MSMTFPFLVSVKNQYKYIQPSSALEQIKVTHFCSALSSTYNDITSWHSPDT